MYLESRLPLPLNYNPFLTFKRDPNESYNDQVRLRMLKGLQCFYASTN